MWSIFNLLVKLVVLIFSVHVTLSKYRYLNEQVGDSFLKYETISYFLFYVVLYI